jgi:TetR/AcrR family transcriptional repressor of bet genes
MSRRSNTEQRRAQIVDALLAVMSEQGYEKATIQLVAQKAGLAPGLLHYHFKTKSEILLELVKKLAELSHQRYLALSESSMTVEDKLQAYITARLGKGKGADPKAVAAWVIIGAEAVRQVEVREVYQHAVGVEMELIQNLLTNCLKEKNRQTKNVKKLAAGLLAFMEGAYQLASAAPGIMPTGYAASTAIQMMNRYIESEPSTLNQPIQK